MENKRIGMSNSIITIFKKSRLLLVFPMVSAALTILSPEIRSADREHTDNLRNELHSKWVNGAEYTLEIASMIEAEEYDFRPVKESMSIGEQLLHIIANMDWLGTNYLNAKPHSMPLRDTIYEKDELISILNEGFENAARAIKKLPKDQMDEVVDFFAGPMTKRQIVHLMHDHHTHHRGQLIVYLRLMGLQPPRYRGW